MNESKYKKYVMIWGIILIVLQSFILIGIISNSTISSVGKTISLCVEIAIIVLLVLFLTLSLKKKKAGPILGIIAGAVYILNLSLVNIIIGACFIISCIDMLKELNKQQ